ncbi:MAG: HTTM domain-containing protein [Myxococcales bacterium]|nr:HTTM domain-containing protein [Myxococcales bacterium]
MARLRSALHAPVDAAGLAVFRMLFGGLMAYGALRFLANGWVDRFFVKPTFFFKYWGFHWVVPIAPPVTYGAFVVMALSALAVAVGFYYRVAIVAFLVSFLYIELLDVTNYLNHYYLVSLLALWMAFLPLERYWSVDAQRTPARRSSTLPAYVIYVLRFQVGVVYFYAALAKFGPDWLLHAQPLGLWMRARTDLPLIGPFLDDPWVPLLLGWAGFLNDLLAAPLLLWRRTRPWMYGTIVVFHLATKAFFSIGLFPFIMIIAATVFFDPTWPRRWVGMARGAWAPPWLRRRAATITPATSEALPPVHPLRLAVFAGFCALQFALPLRAHLYGGDVLWHEQGMRYSWRVMVRQKNGYVMYRVLDPATGREVHVPPSRYLADYQEREMSGQPDLILQLAHHVHDAYVAKLGHDVEVRVDAFASLNGRGAARLIDPTVDLAKIHDGVAKAHWILPAPDAPPFRVPGTFADLGSWAP